ncbi:MAG: lipopolysaccharide biosynthesis protein [Paludibacteraceae bacterium]|nr:lipopolysaccharide biosynthesis protein [Paludibacteraceae bacterium]MBP9970820.1 lipopolysaccharide biosynthesis protein [Paludibacteraceae bacterium]HPL93870.1 lipopolysaccharide biosynthesis protein [Paludibacteraceae bacterium]
MSNSSLKDKMIGALAWSSVDRVAQQGIQFIFGIILARLLAPDDFGLLGMIMIFATLSYVLVESGFSAALIRKEDANETDYNSVFYVNLAISVALFVLLFFTIPYFAEFFKQPALVSTARITFIAVIFNAFYLVPYVQVNRAMDFKTLAKINLFATLCSGSIGITLAILDYGVWALVYQQIGYQFFRGIGFYALVRWIPSFTFSLDSIKHLWKFSMHILGSSLLTIGFNNLYTFLLSRFYPIKQVGYYTQANKMSETANFTFQAILASSTYNLFTQIQADKERLLRVYRQLIQHISLVVIPVSLVLMVVAKPLFFVLFSEKWLPAVPYFQLLCVANVFAPLYLVNMNVLNSLGESKRTFYIEIIKRLFILISIVVCFQFGIQALLAGYAIACTMAFVFSTIYIKKHLRHYFFHQLNDVIMPIMIGISIALIAWSMNSLISNLYLLLVIQLLLALVVYIIILRFFCKEKLYGFYDYIKRQSKQLTKK